MNLQRFIDAQEINYAEALAEIKNGRKVSHWMWYVFPQLRGRGNSPKADYYGIKSLEEAKVYLEDPLLGMRLIEISSALLPLEISAKKIFGYPDYKKLKSCMTLFALVSKEDSIFIQVLEKYYHGRMDETTLKMLGVSSSKEN